MSEQTQNTPSAPCDALLDYAYGELEGAAKEAFEQHLAECEKCKRELEAFGKVRGAARAALPLLDPPAAATGALHAQLLHAAAQRKPSRATTGKLLSFPRRVMQHPGLLAAASLMVIGGALGLNWSKGHLFMPAAERTPAMAEPAKVDLPKGATTAPVVAAAPAATPATPAPALDETTTLEGSLAKDKAADTKVLLDVPKMSAPMKVRHAAPPKEPEFEAKPAKNADSAGELDLRQPADPNSFGAVTGAGGAAKKEAPAARGRYKSGQGDVMNYVTDGKAAEKTTAPAEEAPAPYRNEAPAAAAPAPPPAPKPAPPATRSQVQTVAPNAGYAAPEVKQQKADSWQQPVQSERQVMPEPQAAESVQSAAPPPARKHSGKKSAAPAARDDNGIGATDDARKAFLEAAKSNNCSEVIRIYSDQTRTKRVWATPDEDAEFTRCVSQARREQQSIDNAEQKRASKAKKAAKPAAADAPAQAAPPPAKSNSAF
jgi:hypothetical protein